MTYTLWVPPDATRLRGLIVHQHGCGAGACQGGATAAHDLHWQALAKKWDCALLGPSYQQSDKQACALWCDPRNGSEKAFLQAIRDLAGRSGHPELEQVPWCLWGHSGGGYWANIMAIRHPDRVVAAWFRSGTADLWPDRDRASLEIPASLYGVPMMCNPGVKEENDKQFHRIWTANLATFRAYRAKGAPIGFAPDPRTNHECGDSRYLAIPFFDACLAMRLPAKGTDERKLKAVDMKQAWLAAPSSAAAVPAADYAGEVDEAVWLPNAEFANAWIEYVKTGAVGDVTPPPAPFAVRAMAQAGSGVEITWDAEADLESGLQAFIIDRDGKPIGQVPEKPIGKFGRPLFQAMSYHDTPEKPLPVMRYVDASAKPGEQHAYGVVAVNSVGIKSAPALARSEPAARPNIVVILADDQGWGDLSANGNANLATPNIDSLASGGVRFERFYVCPVCSPTRAEFLTGRYHPRGGVRGVSTGGERLDLDEKTIADAFKAAGYATGAFGKWHNGTQYPYHPNGRGFDEYYGFTSGHWGAYFDPPLDHNGAAVRGKGFIIDDLTDHAIAFIERNRDRQFFCYVPYNTPHSPMQVPDRFYRKFAGAELKLRADNLRGEDIEHTRAALAMCENIDWNVGRILRRLDELKLAENTIIIYFSDNGPNGWRWNGEMKGRKGSTDEGGVRSPLFMRWPGHIPSGRRIGQIAAAMDLMPTLTDLAGVQPAGAQSADGRSLKPLIYGDAAAWPDRMIFSHWAGKVSVRTQKHRLDSAGRLYDMEADPGQQRDVAREQPDVARRLAAAVERWREELLADQRKDDRPFPVGHARFPRTELPARDGVPHGNVKRSASAPNCSFFQNWTSVDDSITWDIEVATAGRYEAIIHYTCPAGEVGSTIQLSFKGSSIQGRVAEAHDPPLHGAEHDRVRRAGESYVKDFKPLNLGAMELQSGRGELALRAIQIPGSQVMDVRMVELRLLR